MKVNRKEVIEEFNKLYKKLGRIPNRDEMGYRQPVKRLYGGYNNFLRKMGFLPNFLRAKKDYIRYIQELSKELERTPSLNDLEQKGIYRSSIYKMFGSYNNLLRLSGFKAGL